jgi:FkbM family methyltransferase
LNDFSASILSLASRATQRLHGVYLRWRGSFAQEGEDLILEQIFGAQDSGFYVDVGAHHPTRYSNTYRFYRRGWRGINIDAMPGSMALFDELRPRDINIETAILDERRKMKFYLFDEPALNGFSPTITAAREEGGSYHVIGTVELEGRPLRDVLDQYLPSGVEIDFMTIDTEGLDFEVIQSNDWMRFRPKVLLVETNQEVFSSEALNEYMTERGYCSFRRTPRTAFFIR